MKMTMMMHFLLVLQQWHLWWTWALRRLALISLHLMVFARYCCDSFLWKMKIFHIQLFLCDFSHYTKLWITILFSICFVVVVIIIVGVGKRIQNWQDVSSRFGSCIDGYCHFAIQLFLVHLWISVFFYSIYAIFMRSNTIYSESKVTMLACYGERHICLHKFTAGARRRWWLIITCWWIIDIVVMLIWSKLSLWLPFGRHTKFSSCNFLSTLNVIKQGRIRVPASSRKIKDSTGNKTTEMKSELSFYMFTAESSSQT